jgi:adenylosuccinate lyase
LIASSLEKFSIELRHLQRTEVLEAEEYFSEGQKGSSAMPHKRNPISAENLSGLARVIRGNSLAAMENVALWHERDISHSSVERIIIPDSTILIICLPGSIRWWTVCSYIRRTWNGTWPSPRGSSIPRP